jgi:hypothetical protein
MSDDDMAKIDLSRMNHDDRMAVLWREVRLPTGVEKAKEILRLMDQERGDVEAYLDRAALRQGAAVVREQATPKPTDSQDGHHVVIVHDLLREYRKDPQFLKVQFRARKNYELRCDRIDKDCGSDRLADLKWPDIQRLYNGWSSGGAKKATGHSTITMFRIAVNFGANKLGNSECVRLSVLLRGMRFKTPNVRTERLTLDQAKSIIAKAHRMGRDSIALAQAFQIEAGLMQMDCIGDWVPNSEPGVSDVMVGNEKWLRGLRWNEIDDNFVLDHPGYEPIDLKGFQLVMSEISRRGERLPSGPMIVDEDTGQPFSSSKFRKLWRRIATAAGVPKGVKNMDSRDDNSPVPSHVGRRRTQNGE